MKRRLVVIIVAILTLAVVVGVVLGVRRCSKDDGSGAKGDGSFNDPNALPWEPV